MGMRANPVAKMEGASGDDRALITPPRKRRYADTTANPISFLTLTTTLREQLVKHSTSATSGATDGSNQKLESLEQILLIFILVVFILSSYCSRAELESLKLHSCETK
ncbi:hypothetical protein NE237_001868 [Protea cynaroides]|uniref:Uncharacterized protein n=1 Tax=Protea cynaroides TaxID=273540 RepID=A0A9Q0KTX1_9MAGN|nr:hypothetical protein NE237_001868 [Protea cynaroides]